MEMKHFSGFIDLECVTSLHDSSQSPFKCDHKGSFFTLFVLNNKGYFLASDNSIPIASWHNILKKQMSILPVKDQVRSPFFFSPSSCSSLHFFFKLCFQYKPESVITSEVCQAKIVPSGWKRRLIVLTNHRIRLYKLTRSDLSQISSTDIETILARNFKKGLDGSIPLIGLSSVCITDQEPTVSLVDTYGREYIVRGMTEALLRSWNNLIMKASLRLGNKLIEKVDFHFFRPSHFLIVKKFGGSVRLVVQSQTVGESPADSIICVSKKEINILRLTDNKVRIYLCVSSF